MDKIEEDVKTFEEDLEKIECNPIKQFLKDCSKCIQDCISFFKKKT